MSRCKLKTLILLIILMILTTNLAPITRTNPEGLANTSWPMFMHDSQHTGMSPYVGPQTNSTKWEFMTGRAIQSSPVIAQDGIIYFGCNDNYTYALNPDGTLKWKYKTGGIIPFSPAIGSDGTIYVGSYDGYCYALNPDGTLKWRYYTGGGATHIAIGPDGTIYFTDGQKYLYAIRPDGTLKWKYECRSGISSPAIGSDGTIYFRGYDGKWYLYALNPDGTLKWRYYTGGGATYIAIGPDGTIYTICGDFYLHAIRPDGTLKWKYETVYWGRSLAIGPDGTIYLTNEKSYSTPAYLRAIRPDGTLKWKYEFEDYVTPTGGSIAIDADGTIYVGTYYAFYWHGYLYAFKPDGTLKWKYNTRSGILSPLAIDSDGTIYVGDFLGYLYAIGGRKYFMKLMVCQLYVEDKIWTAPLWFKGERLVVLPAAETKKLTVRVQFTMNDEALGGKLIRLFIDDAYVSESISRATFDPDVFPYTNLDLVAYVNLPYGLHKGKLVFDGDDKYPECSTGFTILAYKSSGFQVEKDGYSFGNWRMSLSDFLEFMEDDPEFRELGPFSPLFYPLISFEGHCFGMAYTASLYKSGGLAKPRNTDVHSLTRNEAARNIRRYHIAQVPFLLGIYPSEHVTSLKRLIDDGSSPVIGYIGWSKTEEKMVGHTVVGIGYIEVNNTFYLIAYDVGAPDFYRVFSVDLNAGTISDPFITAQDTYEIRLIIRPFPILSELVDNLMGSIRKYIGVMIHSSVDIKITSLDGGVLQTAGDKVLRNSFGESKVYLSDEAKILLLPANTAYDVELTSKESGTVSIACTVPKEDSILCTEFNDVSVSINSKISLTVKPATKTDILSIDTNNDGKTDLNLNPSKYYIWDREGVKEVFLEVLGIPLTFIHFLGIILGLTLLIVTIIILVAKRRL